MPNGIFGTYQFDESISNIWVLGSNSQVHSNYKSIVCKQTIHNLIRRRVLQPLI